MASNKSGIFTLGDVAERQETGSWDTVSDVWAIGSPVIVVESNVGYFAGGRTATSPATSVSSAVHRVDYSNDNILPLTRGPISQNRQYTASIASLNYGYTIAGMTDIADTTQTTTIERLDFANDTEISLVKGPLSDGIKGGGTAGSRDYGYYGGGHNHPNGNRSTLSRIDYSNDTAVAAAKGPLALNTAHISATGNQSYGYWSGGVYAGSNQSTVQRLDYSSDSTAAVAKGPLSAARKYRAATGNANFGYFGGGFNPSVSTADRIDYSSDTSDGLAKGPLAVAYYSLGATGNTTHGYWAGGAAHVSTVQRLDYASDTTAGIERAFLVNGTDRFGGMSAAANALGVGLKGAASNTSFTNVPVGTGYGYFAGGQTAAPANVSTIERVDYSNDTPTASVKGPLTSARYKIRGVSSTSHGYVGGGSPGSLSTIDRIDYFSDTSTALHRTNLASAVLDHAGAGNANYGYFAGGLPVSTVQRIEYASDTANTVIRGPLSAARRYLAGMGNLNYGYFGAGTPGPGNYSTVDRIDYSNDTPTAVAKGPLPAALQQLGATGNENFGYWTGGQHAIPGSNVFESTIQRIDYSTDTTSPTPKGTLSVGRSTKSTGNSSFGYSGGGGGSPSWDKKSTIDRIDYSNDTATAASKGPLNAALRKHSAFSSRANALPTQNIYSTNVSSSEEVSGTRHTGGTNYGYWAGGTAAPTSVTRLDYGNDTAAMAPKGFLSHNKYSFGGTSSKTHAYWIGGQGEGTKVDRTEYSNDTATALLKGYLTASMNYQATVGNINYGYSMGSPGGPKSTVNRIDYANDTATATEKGPLSVARGGVFGGAGNHNYGYAGGGVVQPGTNFKTTVDRVDYSNDTATASPKGPLNANRYYMGAAGNANYGWFGCGYGSPSSSLVDRVDYSSDTATASTRGPLSQAGKGFYGSTGNRSYGYFGGGGPGGPGSRVDRVDYSNDTVAYTAMSNLPVALMKLTATSSEDNALQDRFTISTPFAFGNNPTTSYPYGYYGDGNNYTTLVERIDYANDNNAPSRRGYLSAGGGVYVGGVASLNHGYFIGGDVSPNTVISRVERIDFSNDMVHSSIRGPLSTVRVGTMATGTKDYGYVGGGNDAVPGPSHTTTIDRINYANDTSTASPRGPLNESTNYGGATGYPSYGYFGGGLNKSLVNRLDYSNDTVAAAEKGPLSAAGTYQSATGNKDYGWWGGGSNGPGVTTVDRLDYSNDTAVASVRGSLNTGRYRHGATGNTTHGYFMGGQPGTITSIERIDYSNDTVTAQFVAPILRNSGNSLRGAFSSQANALPQTYSQGTAGLSGAGYVAHMSKTTVDRIDFANDTATASTRGPLTSSKYWRMAVSSTSHGYFAGGGSGPISLVDRVDYSNDTPTALQKGPLSVPGAGGDGVGNENFGYISLGYPGNKSFVDRIDYGNDTVAGVAKGPLSAGRYQQRAVGNKSYAYFAGGNPGPISTVDRIDYNNDTVAATPKGPLTNNKKRHSSSGNDNFGYMVGGAIPSPVANTSVDRIDYSNDTATARPSLSAEWNFSINQAGTGNQSYGYHCGGGKPTGISAIQRIDYSSDTAILIPRGFLSGAGNGPHNATSSRENALPIIGSTVAEFTNNVPIQKFPASQKGYIVGGSNPDPGPFPATNTTAAIQSIDFPNDTATATAKGNLSYTKQGHAAVGNSYYGYVGGTGPAYSAANPSPGMKSTVERIDFGNDTAATLIKGPLTLGREGLAAVGNSDYGYFGGGREPSTSSRVDRLDYSSDSTACASKANLSASREVMAACGNADFGYWQGGNPYSIVYRTDYSNDSTTPTPKGNLSVARYGHGATGNANYGWSMGGYGSPAPISSVDRITYSNDTATATPKGPLSQATSYGAGTGNRDYGYIAGGIPGNPRSSTVNRVDFSNDTAASLIRGYLIWGISNNAACSGGTNGLPQ